MKNFIVLCFALVCVPLVFSVAVFASEQSPVTVDVEGYAVIDAGKKDVARENALQDSFRRAIEQVVGVMVEAKTVVSDATLLQDKIYSKSAGFIKTYKINSEVFESTACRINIKATVSKVRLVKGLNDIGLLMKKMGKPRVAVIMTEQNIGNDAPSGSLGDGSVNAGIADSVIYEVLAKKGYNLVDRETLVALAKREGVLSANGTISSNEAAIQVAAGGGAEVVIIGQAVAKAGSSALSGSNMRSSQATVTARVVDVDTGQLIATNSASSKSANVNSTAGGGEAIASASKKLIENLNRQILAKWKLKVAGTRLVKLNIKDIEFSDISKVKELLRERLKNVEETVERGYRDGTLNLDTEVSGTARELAEELTNTKMDGYVFKIISYTVNTLNVQLQKK